MTSDIIIQWDIYYKCNGCFEFSYTHLLSVGESISYPFAELRAPVLQHVGLRILLALTIAEAALGAGGSDHVHRMQVDF